MATIITTSDAPEATVMRAAASLRLTVRLELAEMLSRIIPPFVTVTSDDGDVDLLPTEAREAALDAVEELEGRGYRIVRAPL